MQEKLKLNKYYWNLNFRESGHHNRQIEDLYNARYVAGVRQITHQMRNIRIEKKQANDQETRQRLLENQQDRNMCYTSKTPLQLLLINEICEKLKIENTVQRATVERSIIDTMNGYEKKASDFFGVEITKGGKVKQKSKTLSAILQKWSGSKLVASEQRKRKRVKGGKFIDETPYELRPNDVIDHYDQLWTILKPASV